MKSAVMVRWQQLPDRVRAGIRFALATVLIGPTMFTLLGWAAEDFRRGIGEVLRESSITTVHFFYYALLFFPAVAWARSRRVAALTRSRAPSSSRASCCWSDSDSEQPPAPRDC